MINKNIFYFLRLHIILVVYSLGTVCSKMALTFPAFSIPFFVCYGGVFLSLGVYAIGWQQIIKHVPLTTAFANKAITVVWGIVWGLLFFNEQITIGKATGALLVVLGVILYARVGDDHAD